MATLKKRRNVWYARVRWYDNNNIRHEKQVPLRTMSKVTARKRLSMVDKEESDGTIKTECQKINKSH